MSHQELFAIHLVIHDTGHFFQRYCLAHLLAFSLSIFAISSTGNCRETPPPQITIGDTEVPSAIPAGEHAFTAYVGTIAFDRKNHKVICTSTPKGATGSDCSAQVLADIASTMPTGAHSTKTAFVQGAGLILAPAMICMGMGALNRALTGSVMSMDTNAPSPSGWATGTALGGEQLMATKVRDLLIATTNVTRGGALFRGNIIAFVACTVGWNVGEAAADLSAKGISYIHLYLQNDAEQKHTDQPLHRR